MGLGSLSLKKVLQRRSKHPPRDQGQLTDRRRALSRADSLSSCMCSPREALSDLEGEAAHAAPWGTLAGDKIGSQARPLPPTLPQQQILVGGSVQIPTGPTKGLLNPVFPHTITSAGTGRPTLGR